MITANENEQNDSTNEIEKEETTIDVKSYHDSYDLSGSNFNGEINFISTKAEKAFFEITTIDTPEVSSWYDFKPRLTNLVESLRDNGILFLGGEIDQLDQLARKIAIETNLQEEFLENDSSEENSKKIYEWKGLDYGRGVVPLIEEECEQGIIILPQLKPENFHYNLSSLVSLGKKSRKLIITTALDSERWQHQLNNKHINVETPNYQQLFTSEDRRNFITHTFSNLKNNNCIDIQNLDSKISPNNTAFLNLCENIGSFETIFEFLGIISSRSSIGKVEFRDAQIIAEELNDKLNRLITWYDNLEFGEKLLCIFSSVFHSISTEQLLELIEIAVLKIWRPMYGNLPIFDQQDLKSLNKYFTLKKIGDGQEKLEPRNFKIPSKIINHALDNQRRYVTAILPFCVYIIEESVKKEAEYNSILYENKADRESIRQDISSYLALLGEIKFSMIESSLLKISCIDSYDARQTVANTLAVLYLTEKNSLIINTLESWTYKQSIKEKLQSLAPKLKHNNGQQTKEILRTTVILTTIEILRHCHPEKIPLNLYNFLEKFLNSSNSKKEYYYIINYFMPNFFLLHFPNAINHINYFISLPDLTREILAFSISLGQYIFPEELKKFLHDQINQSRDSKERHKNLLTDRIVLLYFATATLRHIEYSRKKVINIQEAFDYISEILTTEHHPEIRNSSLQTLVVLSSQYQEIVDHKFQKVIESLTNSERDLIANDLYLTYLYQRKNQKDFEETIEIEGKTYPTWIDSKRPKMPIEITLSKWMENASTVPSTRLAYKADTLIHNFDEIEKNIIDNLKKERELINRNSAKQKFIPTINLDKSNEKISLYSRIISIPLGTKKYKTSKDAIVGILPEALKQTRETQMKMIERRKLIGEDINLPLALAAVLKWERRKPALIILTLFFIFVTGLYLNHH